MTTTTETEAVLVPQLTREQAAIVGAYTGVLCSAFSDLHALIEQLVGRPVFTHELADPMMKELIRDRAKARFLAICAEGTLMPPADHNPEDFDARR